jgi:predicted DNA-binding transcriptional regulator AlpA
MLVQRPHAERTPRDTGSRLSELSDECLITSKPVREICGNCSDMHIWRLLNEEKYLALAFPKPIKINDRNYWRLGAIRRWICEQEVQSQAITAPVSTPRNSNRSAMAALRARARGKGSSVPKTQRRFGGPMSTRKRNRKAAAFTDNS